jgi:hypothetical protein
VSAPSATIPTTWIEIRRAAVLIAVGGLPVFVMLLRKTLAYGSLAK